MNKPVHINSNRGTDGGRWVTNGKLARSLGIDPKTLRKWAKRGLVPSYINRLNGYRYYVRSEVIAALKAEPGSKIPIGKTGKASRL